MVRAAPRGREGERERESETQDVIVRVPDSLAPLSTLCGRCCCEGCLAGPSQALDRHETRWCLHPAKSSKLGQALGDSSQGRGGQRLTVSVALVRKLSDAREAVAVGLAGHPRRRSRTRARPRRKHDIVRVYRVLLFVAVEHTHTHQAVRGARACIGVARDLSWPVLRLPCCAAVLTKSHTLPMGPARPHHLFPSSCLMAQTLR